MDDGRRHSVESSLRLCFGTTGLRVTMVLLLSLSLYICFGSTTRWCGRILVWRCLFLQWYLAACDDIVLEVWSDDSEGLLGVSRGSGDPTWSLSTLSIVWAMTSRGFDDETGGTMVITTRCSWLIAVVGTFLLYSWSYMQKF